MDIVYGKKNVMVNAEMWVGKRLIYQAMLLINPGAIILTIIPTIVLMEDQERKLKQRDVRSLALTAATVEVDPNIWKLLEQGEYTVIFASPEIVFMPQSHFWKHTVSRNGNKVCCRLACIAVNEAHLIWR